MTLQIVKKIHIPTVDAAMPFQVQVHPPLDQRHRPQDSPEVGWCERDSLRTIERKEKNIHCDVSILDRLNASRQSPNASGVSLPFEWLLDKLDPQ